MILRFFISLMAFAVLSCSPKEEPPPPQSQEAPEPELTALKGQFLVVLKTSEGDIAIELTPSDSPATVANFLAYVNRGFYDNTVFHQVVDSFRIQTGGFALNDSRLVEKEAEAPIPSEARNGLTNDRGTVAMTRTHDPDSATSQFFINVRDNIGLNPGIAGAGYTVFGKVVSGMDVVDRISQLETSTQELTMRHPTTAEQVIQEASDVPVKPVIIHSAKQAPMR